MVAEFLEEYRWEPRERRAGLLDQEPAPTGDEHWDVFLAALTEHLAAKDGRGAPLWVETRSLRRFRFPFNTRAARVDAVVHALAAFRRRGGYVSAQELKVAAASPEHLSAMKVLAARRRDTEDIRFLVDHFRLTSTEQVLGLCGDLPRGGGPGRVRLCSTTCSTAGNPVIGLPPTDET